MIVLTTSMRFEARKSKTFPVKAIVKYLARNGKLHEFDYYGKTELDASMNCIDMLHSLHRDGNLKGCETTASKIGNIEFEGE